MPRLDTMSADREPSRPRTRRDRHGRGLRGALAPQAVPVGRTRAERFDDLVVEAFGQVTERWAVQLAGVEVVVEDVPPSDGPVLLGRTEPASRRRAAQLVLYRRPIEARARESLERGDLVHHVVVGLVADLLGLTPEQIDPEADD